MDNMYSGKISHFGVNIKNSPKLQINRDTYATIDKRNHCNNEVYMLKTYQKEVLQKYYEDDECTIYTDDWCEQHRKKCLQNFDLNMIYMNSLSTEEFEKELNTFIKKAKKLKQIFDLNDCDYMEGIYVMVLDKYKQVYIGQSTNIKKRIMTHWSKTKQFDRLLFGSVEKSVLSIDSFGALDTTRIFVYPTYDIYKEEEKLVKAMNSKYMLNRTGGGIGLDNETYKLEILANVKYRNFEKS